MRLPWGSDEPPYNNDRRPGHDRRNGRRNVAVVSILATTLAGHHDVECLGVASVAAEITLEPHPISFSDAALTVKEVANVE